MCESNGCSRVLSTWMTFARRLAGVMKVWYTDGEKMYDYNKPGFGVKTAQFTQVVWKSSVRLGCAMAPDDDERKENSEESWSSYWYCYFVPTGNFLKTVPLLPHENPKMTIRRTKDRHGNIYKLTDDAFPANVTKPDNSRKNKKHGGVGFLLCK